MFTSASETLRLSGIDQDINTGERYRAIKPRVLAMDRVTGADDIRRLLASPDVVVGSVAALTETGSLVAASGSGSQLPGYAGGAARRIWIVGAQKVVPDLSTALRRVEDHCLPLESARTQVAYGQPSAINHLLILNAEPYPGRSTVLLLREAVGFRNHQEADMTTDNPGPGGSPPLRGRGKPPEEPRGRAPQHDEQWAPGRGPV